MDVTMYIPERKERPVIRRAKCQRKCWVAKTRKMLKWERLVW